MGKHVGLGQYGDFRRNRQHANPAQGDYIVQKLRGIHTRFHASASDGHGYFPQADIAAGELEVRVAAFNCFAGASREARGRKRIEEQCLGIENDHCSASHTAPLGLSTSPT